MTEEQWLSCTDPAPMLTFVGGVAADRPLRLFVVDCCRRLWHLFTDKPYRRAVEVAERFAERGAGVSELAAVNVLPVRLAEWGTEGEGVGPLWCAGWFSNTYTGALDSSSSPAAPAVLAMAASMGSAQAGAELCVPWAAALGVDQAVMATVVRDVVHAPYRSVFFKSSWLAWHDGVLLKTARSMYDERRFGDLPLLADALEEAGCDNRDILDHCRSGGEHVRGCWVVDLLLGKS